MHFLTELAAISCPKFNEGHKKVPSRNGAEAHFCFRFARFKITRQLVCKICLVVKHLSLNRNQFDEVKPDLKLVGLILMSYSLQFHFP